MQPHRVSLLVCFIAAGTVTGARSAPPLEILLTADAEGRLAPADASEGGAGGIARRATVIAAARREAPALLLLDAGNALFGGDSTENGGAGAVAAYDALAYDALNISYRDFRRGKDATLSALKDAKTVAISANLLDASTGAPLFKPYVVVKRGDERVAIVGAIEPPVALDFLPHLKAQLAGIRVEPPIDALAKWLPKARSESDRVLLLFYGSPNAARSILAKHGASLAAILVGGCRPQFVPADAKPPVIATGALGSELARVTLTGSGADSKADVRRLPVDASTPADAEVEKLVAPFVAAKASPIDGAPAVAAARAELPASIETDRTYRLDLTAENRGARLTIHTASLVASYSGSDAPGGRAFLLLDAEWENIIPLTLIEEQKVPTEYRIPNLADHLYLVANGSRLERLRPDANGLAGHVPVKDFRLARIGSRIRGNIVFPVVPGIGGSLEVRFYDYAHGHFVLPLRSSGSAAAEPAKPLGPPQTNEVLELAAYGFEALADLDGRAAPAGLQYISIDLRARSLFTVDADATAFDPKARPGARLKIGNVADWLESRRYAQLVADGEYAYAPLPASSLEEEPRFLPDIPTGGRLVFLAPAQRASLALRCDFPNAKSSLDGKTFRPQGITIALEGQRPRLETRKAVVSIVDDVFNVSVTGLSSPGELAGRKAGDGEKFLALDVTVSNSGKKGEFFQSLEQLKIALAKGTLVPIDAAAQETARPPLPLVWIPPDERRSFQAVYRLPASETKPRLAYAGVSLKKTLELPAAGAPAVIAKAAPPPAQSRPAAAQTEKAQPAAKNPPAGEKPREATGAAAAAAAPVRREPRGLTGVGLTPEKVNEAIDRGAAFLWGHLKAKDFKENGMKLGDAREHWICALALVHAGAHKKFPDLDASLRTFLPAIDPRRGDVYQSGITCMIVEAFGDPSFLPSVRAAARYILEVQGPQGSWTYTRNLTEKLFRDPAADQIIQVSGGIPLDGADTGPVTSRISDWKDGQDGDNSVSQYAILGLQAAAEAGISISPEVWERSIEAFRSRQGPDGNWYYNAKARTGYGSMTCAGICSLAIARHQHGEKEPANDPAIENGLAWLEHHFSVTTHAEFSPPMKWFFYYLYSLERVGRVLGLDFIGSHEWYPEGARQLLSTQKPDGSWVGFVEELDPRLATSFALLFLTRSTSSLKPVDLKRGGNGILKTGILLPRGNRYYIILDASGSMTETMDGKTKWQIAKDAVARLVEDLADNSEVALRVYGHRKRAIEEGASDDTALEMPLRRLVKKDFLAKLDTLRPRGKTPLARSLLEAKRDLGSAAATEPITVILLTDGGEDTLPRQDPVKAAAELGTLKGVRFHVIGFDIGRADWNAQLQAVAEQGRGSYWPAMKADSLNAELRSAVFGVPAGFQVVDASGKESARGVFGQEMSLPEGAYVFRTSYAGAGHEEKFWINTERTTSVVFNAARAAGLQPAPGAASAKAAAAPVPGPVPAAEPAASPANTKPAPQPAAKGKFCSECGKPLKPDAKFCMSCGAKVKA